ncbi:hypothetical protein HMPREF1207_02931 [Paenibacillus sp. HGH0039]|nr:hypothetical protein HMPREF1207_02931 [Paenibacillus sp. HGH0039]
MESNIDVVLFEIIISGKGLAFPHWNLLSHI